MRTYEVTSNDPKVKEVLEKFVLDCSKAIAQAIIPSGVPIVKEMFTVMLSQPNPNSNKFRLHIITPPLPRPMAWVVFRKVKGQIKKYLEGMGIKNCEVKEIKDKEVAG